jgi:hypothetical protein
VVDSGATEHCFWCREDFSEYREESREGNAVEGSKFHILASGTIWKFITYEGQRREIILDTIHTPDITSNLISISKLDAKGYRVEFSNEKAIFKHSDSSPFMEALLSNGMYVLAFDDNNVSACIARSWDVPVDKGTWHCRLGHIGNTGLDGLISGMHVNSLHVCEGGMDSLCEDCILGKQTRCLFNGVHEVEKEVGERSYLDLWGPAQVTSVGSKHYMFHIVKGHLGALWTYYLAHKTAEESLVVFKLYKAEVETQTGKKLQIIRVDGGREWINHLWERFCGAAGIIIEVTTPHSSSQNGPGECGICTTVEFGRCLLFDSGLPKSMWPTAFDAATYLQWFHPRRCAGGKTPYKIFKKKPDVSHLRAYGSTAYAKIVPIEAAGGKPNP